MGSAAYALIYMTMAGTLLQQTTTDSNGYYGFNVHPGQYILEFLKPPGMEFVQRDAGEEDTDSDVDPATGRTDTLDIQSSLLHVDVGLIPLEIPPPSSGSTSRPSGTRPLRALGLRGHRRLLPRLVFDLCLCLRRSAGGIAILRVCGA